MKSEQTTADRRKREAAQGPVILYGTPSQGEIAQARGAGRGVLVLPEEMRDSLIASGGGWTAPYDPYGLVSSEREAEPEFHCEICGSDTHDALVHDPQTTMAEEPIEERLRRAWLNGYTDGYSEGFNRAAYQTNWER